MKSLDQHQRKSDTQTNKTTYFILGAQSRGKVQSQKTNRQKQSDNLKHKQQAQLQIKIDDTFFTVSMPKQLFKILIERII